MIADDDDDDDDEGEELMRVLENSKLDDDWMAAISRG